MQLVLANSETVIVGAPSLGLSELQCFEQHALNIGSVSSAPAG
jgi:hypothetical protein